MSTVNFFTFRQRPADCLARLVSRSVRVGARALAMALTRALTTLTTGCSSPPPRQALRWVVMSIFATAEAVEIAIKAKLRPVAKDIHCL